MKITAAPSPRGTNNERLFLFQCPRGAPRSLRSTRLLKRHGHNGDDRDLFLP